ncbi:CCDC113, partial [Symbiodinium microadriaticum]
VVSLKQDLDRINLENSVYQKYYDRKIGEMGVEEEDKKKAKSKNRRQPPSTLNIDQKYDIAIAVQEELYNDIEKNKKNYEKMIDTLRAVLEETEIRISELKRDAYEFKSDVVVGAENSRTGKIMAERVTRHLEEKLKSKDSMIEKLRLKNATLKSQIHKVEKQLSQKEEIGDVLHYIDFHQLQIENKQYVAKIEERNEELLTVKLSTGKTLRVLNDLKRHLADRLSESEWLMSETSSKAHLLHKLSQEVNKVNKEVTMDKRAKNKLRQQIDEASEMPNVEDYIMQKRSMYDLQNTLKNWEKKVEILEMAAKKSRTLAKTATLKTGMRVMSG